MAELASTKFPTHFRFHTYQQRKVFLFVFVFVFLTELLVFQLLMYFIFRIKRFLTTSCIVKCIHRQNPVYNHVFMTNLSCFHKFGIFYSEFAHRQRSGTFSMSNCSFKLFSQIDFERTLTLYLCPTSTAYLQKKSILVANLVMWIIISSPQLQFLELIFYSLCSAYLC